MKVVFAQIGACAVLCYFAYHAMAGEQGLAEWTRLQKHEAELSTSIATLKQERDALHSQISRLKSDQLDLDFVEELSRKKLAFARENELIIFTASLD